MLYNNLAVRECVGLEIRYAKVQLSLIFFELT
jgi:hypothetical protein